MRIVIDMQGAQTASRFRGIGRYTLALVTEMARQRGSHEMLLVLNGAYADTIEPLRAAFAELLPFDGIRVFEVAGPVGGHDTANDARRKAAEAMYEAFIASLKPDVLFIPSLFEEFGGDAVTSVHSLHNTIPIAITLHDLIPLVHRNVYLQEPAMERWYFNKLDHLRRADLLLPVSDASGREAAQYLNVPESEMVTVANACDDQFHPIVLSDAQRAHLKTAYGIDRPFVMNAGGTDHRKNLDGLFRAFAQLPSEMRQAYALALVGREVADQKPHFLEFAKRAGLREDELVFTGYVSDQDLALLYNACTLFVFPSWHEGFGLPVLEAMACGKAVIAANSSSLPEAVGRADALFAPRDDAAMSAKMAEVLGNPEFRQELERHGLEQAKKFSWPTSAERAWAALHALHTQHQQRAATAASCMPSRRLRLAFVSPLPPEKTGIADYAAELLPELARHYEITVIVEQAEVAEAWVQANTPIRDPAWFRQHAQQFDRVVYQFGNSPFHSHMFDLLAEIPGVVVLHDFYLSWPVWHRDEHGVGQHGWARALLAGHGWGAVRERMQVGSWNDVVEVATTYPCNLAVLQQAQGIIVHSDFSRRLAQQFYGNHAADDWALIPLLRQPAELGGKTDARTRLGLSNTDFIVCSFGGLGTTKMNHRLLDAWLASPLAQDAACRLVFVGENHGGEYGQALVQTIAQSPAKDRIIITGWADVETYRTWLAAADAGVQLRTLSRGETSAAVLDCMNYGLPTIVNANGSMADLPTDAVWLLPDAFDDAQLVDALVVLHRDTSKREALGARARQHILTQHNPRTCAKQYAQAIESAYSQALQGLHGLLHALPRLSTALQPCEYPALAGTLAANFPPSPRRRQLLLDISALVKTDLWSGIERVTRALMAELIKSPPAGWAVEPVYATTDQPGYRYARQYTSRFLNMPDNWAEDALVQVWQGNIFLGLDLLPQAVVAQEPTLQSWRRRGIKCYFVVHDLLPVTMPDVFPEGARDGHQRWLQTISRFDGAFCVSRHVADEFYEWLQIFGEQRQRPFTLNWFHHGADVANSAPSLGLPDDAAQTLAALKARPSFLMVGTIEPRKGCLQTLQAFDALWAQGVDVNLVIVGKDGWKPLPDSQRRDIPQTIQALRNHPQQGKRLFWLEGISDEYLEQVYTHAACLIAASFDEGFGLPLIEAARHGVPLLVRDIPVFREVTDGHAYYFADRREPQVIQEAIQQWLALFEQGTHPRSTAMPHQTWKESAQQVLDGIFARTAPYKTWLPDGVRRYWGADPRMHTEVGRRSGKAIQTTGKAGMLIYGPYEQFVPGHYRVVISGESKHWTGEEWLDVTCDEGKRKLFYSDLGAMSLGAWHHVFEFELNEVVADLEIRASIDVNSYVAISTIEIIRLTNSIHSDRKMTIYGPYDLPKIGKYRAVISGKADHWGELNYIDVSYGEDKKKITRLHIAQTHKLGQFDLIVDFEIAKPLNDVNIEICADDNSEIQLNAAVISEFIDLEAKKRKVYDFINKSILQSGPALFLDKICDDVRGLQTCDPFRYKKILDVSAAFNKKCLTSSNIKLNLYYGIKYGIYPHHATYNRVKILRDWLDGGYCGWVLYIDADSIISKPDYDFVSFFKELRKKQIFLWLSQDSTSFDHYVFNAGVFAVDLGNEYSRQIIKAWSEIYSDFYNPNDYLFATSWDDIINDQDSLSKIIQEMVSVHGESFLSGIKYGELQSHWKLGWDIKLEHIFFSALRSEAGGISAEEEMDARVNAIQTAIGMISCDER